MTARNVGKAYRPVLVHVERFTQSGKGMIVLPLQAQSCDTQHLPFKGQTVLIQYPNSSGFSEPVDPSTLSAEQRADLMLVPGVIAWIQNWLLVIFKETGEEVPVMTPPTPKAKEVKS